MTTSLKTIVPLALALFALLSYQFIAAQWTDAPANPPQNNVEAPLNVGATEQIKNGKLGVAALSVFGQTYVQGTTTNTDPTYDVGLDVHGSTGAELYCDRYGQNCFAAADIYTAICAGGACDPVSYTYSWTNPSYGNCSVSCGGGTQTRTVECQRDQDSAIVADSFCTGTKPAESQSCNTSACAPVCVSNVGQSCGSAGTCMVEKRTQRMRSRSPYNCNPTVENDWNDSVPFSYGTVGVCADGNCPTSCTNSSATNWYIDTYGYRESCGMGDAVPETCTGPYTGSECKSIYWDDYRARNMYSPTSGTIQCDGSCN